MREEERDIEGEEESKPEVARHFNDIWEEHHNPKRNEKKRLLTNREIRAKIIKEDCGL